mmetsp:Transcript_3819/g.3564  ORF Transcript_3819/g.3564 Transcript_3819/m.3564 type:complete len:110 (-) Transcript_3819:188-517(-)
MNNRYKKCNKDQAKSSQKELRGDMGEDYQKLNQSLKKFLNSQPSSPRSRRSARKQRKDSLCQKVKLIKYDDQLGRSFYCETHKFNLTKKPQSLSKSDAYRMPTAASQSA